MRDWKDVEQERLKLGEPLPADCALVRLWPDTVKVGTKLFYGDSRCIAEISHPSNSEVALGKGQSIGVDRRNLYRVVEPVPTKHQKLGRLPAIGEKFWVEMECLDIDHDCDVKAEIVDNVGSNLDDVVWLKKRAFIDDPRHDELKTLKVQLLDLETKIYDLEASIRKSK